MEAVHYLIGLFMIITLQCGALNRDGQALISVKQAMVDEMGHLNDWVQTDPTPCGWTGVQCDFSSEMVVSLDLSDMNLTGTLSPAIGSLAGLVNLSLDLNNLTGSLPPELGALQLLRSLNISHNNFGHQFPANISSLKLLENLDAYNNNFSGPLPPELGKLQNLKHLHLGGSYFEGPIPPEYGEMKHLKYMALAGNSLSGRIPPELGNLSQLQYLYLGYYNTYSGGIPPEFGRLSNLIRLDLSYCTLNGTIPTELGNLKKLDSLFLQINSLVGIIPEELGLLTNLKSLDLSNNQLSGTIPASFNALHQLELVSFFRNQLHGSIPEYFGDLPNLQVLFMWANNLTGPIPANLGRNSKLLKVDLSSNDLNGTIPPDLCHGGTLEILILLGNQLTGPLPESLGNCTSLLKMRLGDNKLTGPIPAGFLQLPNIEMLELVGNQISGDIGGKLNAPNLEFLDFSENQLQGVIPESIGNLVSLKNLWIARNNLSGTIPKNISKLGQLFSLDLNHNMLSGSIPAEIGKCKGLSTMDLSGNILTGEIPPQLTNLQVLDVLNLSRNHLTGSIPQQLEILTSLTTVDFSYNNLSGPIPSKGQFGYFNSTSFVGNEGLCGPEISRPCNATSSENVSALHGRVKSTRGLLAWLVGALFSAALLVLVVGVCCFFKKYQQYIYGLFRRESTVRPWKLTAFQRLDFNASHVLDCLNEDNIIGRGGSGTVYKGVMPSGEIVAVKRLSPYGKKGVSHDHGFSAEIQTLGKIRHRNIVKLLGCCSNHETNALVYEFMPNGSLGELLHDKKGANLNWPTRYKIALQAANGLCYLHHDCSPLIVHRDVKSNNILLDSNFEAHVADFGLAKLFLDSGKSESMSTIAGSYGYIAPEYAYTLKVNEKSDIYSFGVVLLELVTGRRPIESEYGDGVDIVQWVRKKIQTKDGVLEIMDSRMGDANLPVHEVMLVLRVALLCTNDLPVDRPTMRDVVQMLTDVKPKSKDSRDFEDSQGREHSNV